VPQFSISLPSELDRNKNEVVSSQNIGHWPVYLKNAKVEEMESLRKEQGGW
jgi:hypothetical protein